MIRSIVTFTLQQPLFIWLGLVLFISSGLIAFHNLPIEAFPDVSDTQVSVITQYPGQAAEEIEKQVTIPLEIGLSGLPGAIRMFSHTMFGLSYLMITFDDKVDPYFARQQVLERLQNTDMPPGISPEMAPLATAIGEIYRYKIASDYMSPMDLRTLQDWVVSRQLKQIPGVADITSIGGPIKQYQVHPDLKKMQDYQVSLKELFSAIKHANANGGGGPVELGSQQFLLRGIGLLKSSTDINNIAITEQKGVPILVKDIAEVVIEGPSRQGIMGEGKNDDLVSGIIMMRKGENPSIVLKAIKEKVDFLNRQVLPRGVSIVPYYDRAWLIQKTLHTVFGNLREGALLVTGVLFLFLGNLRAAAIVAIIIPLSLLATFIGLTWVGIPANLLSLGGMDFGIIVDGAVIVVENVFHKLGENKEILNHHDRKNKVLEAVTEVSRPTLFSMLIIIAAYIPIFTLQRHEGRIFSPMAYSVTSALIGALILSFTLVPLLCYILLRKDLPHHENKLISQCKNIYQPLLLKALNHSKTIIFIALISLLTSLGIVQKLGTEFLPELDEGTIWINIPLPSGISVSEARAAARKIRSVLQNITEVDTVISKVGRPDDGTDPKLINSTEYLVNLKPQPEWRPGYSKKDLIKEMDQLLATLPGIAPSFSQPIRDNVLESISQIKGQIVIKVFGDDLFILKDLADQVLHAINHISGVSQAFIDQKGDLPQYLIEINREDAAHYGLNVSDLQDLVEVALGGRVATEFWEGERHFSVVVRLKDEDRSPARLQDILIDTPHGGPIPVSEVVDFHIASGAIDISRENGRPVIAIGVFIQDRDMGSVVSEMQQQVTKTITLPKNCSITWSGEFESQKRAMNRLMFVIPLSILLIFILLFNAFNSFKNALLIITNIPFALIGGIFALYLTGLPLSVSAAIGFIALFGQAVLNGVVLVTCFEQLRSKGKTLYQAVVEGSLQRLRTELMTASLAMLGLLPMALSTDIGSEVQRPLAIVIIGGLISATLLTLIVLPTLYLMFSEKPSNQKSIIVPVS
ncbi:efflux RND transporter permease subunit [Candidatus Nitrosacidococcus tergens]|uniref:Cation efflux system protein CzcA n=1 Tax=Candidatus Nitrosacidococcus tergens TaxID=553981 RepID=A0A7G1Q8W0_9GAMM|nr:CusA/CzcA family heavy metal efflux RND transporter [Candidatus Nitrosacidococcus tergens]CAB1275533.1 Cation efflux system protein CzcA [Candidatus Nitrosacidococcus tergens]